MKKIVMCMMMRYRAIVWWCGAVMRAYGIATSAIAARNFLTCRTDESVHARFFTTFIIYLWHVFGSGLLIIPITCLCFGITRFRGMKLHYEQYGASCLWMIFTALVAGLYHVDSFTTGAGGLIGVYGA